MRIDRREIRSEPRRAPLAVCLAAALGLGSTSALAGGNHPAPAQGGASPTGTTDLLARLMSAAPTESWPGRIDRSRFAPHGGGGVQTVSNCNDAGPGSLRAAASAAIDSDTIDLSALTCSKITLTSGAIELTAKDLTVQGPGQGALRVDGNAASPVLKVGKYAHDLAVRDLTLANGFSAGGFGGCIYALNEHLLLERTTVTGCQAGDGSNDSAAGGGISTFGHLALRDSTISGNTAKGAKTAYGGGASAFKYAYVLDGSSLDHNVTIGASEKARGGGIHGQRVFVGYGSRVNMNEARSVDGTAYGGGVFARGEANGNATIVLSLLSTISGNTAHSDTAWAYGGGIQAGDSGSPATTGSITLQASTLSGNTIGANCDYCWIQGGGANALGQIVTQYSTVRDNRALSLAASDGKALGAGLATDFVGTGPSDGAIVVLNSTVSGNQAIGGTGANGRGFGGGIAAFSSPFLAVFSTIAHNSASTLGGGVLESGSGTTSILLSSLIANNTAPSGADLDTRSASTIGFTGDHNLVMAVGPNIALPAGTLRADPKLLPLAGNGGPTATHALAACSPAIDAGAIPTALSRGFGFSNDQRLEPYLRSDGAAPDIGAFERQVDLDHIFGHGFERPPCP